MEHHSNVADDKFFDELERNGDFLEFVSYHILDRVVDGIDNMSFEGVADSLDDATNDPTQRSETVHTHTDALDLLDL